ncbi:MAG: metallophosphoesterase [Bacteroidota bacterium]|nr:metallophosphoesterase [Bacteroidota bacterium]
MKTWAVVALGIPVYLLAIVLFRRAFTLLVRHGRWWLAAALGAFHLPPLAAFLGRWLGGTLPPDMLVAPGGSLRLFLTHAGAGAMIAAAQYIAHAVPLFILEYVSVRFFPSRAVQFRRFSAALFLALALAGGVFVAFRLYEDAVRIESVPAAVSRGDAPPLRVAVLSDLHFDEYNPAARVNSYIDSINATRPDLVLFAGDVASSRRGMTFVQDATACLARLRARLGVFAVLGDHDLWAGGRLDSVATCLERVGIEVLDNEKTLLHIDGNPVLLVGVTNIEPAPVSEAVLDTLIPPKRNQLTIVLVHRCSRRVLSRCERVGVDFVAAGHTHGGQVGCCVVGSTVSVASFGEGPVSGVCRTGETTVFVCNGLGYSVFPLRYLARPTFGVIDISRADGRP